MVINMSKKRLLHVPEVEYSRRRFSLVRGTGYHTGGYYRATPHRVINLSTQQARISIPIFINPPLDALMQPEALSPALQGGLVRRNAVCP